MEIETLSIVGGRGRTGEPEQVAQVDLRMGEVASIVGPTGSGKTELINDIERFANANTPSGRRVLVNGSAIDDDSVADPSRNPIALITQHTNFLSDLPVREFLRIHAEIRQGAEVPTLVAQTVEFANELTGEAIDLENAMTELSGGQTRALLIADAVVIGNSPIILLDEIENAGIHRTRALELLRQYRKIFVFVTHDPRIALLSDLRVVMRGGGMQKVIVRNPREQRVADVLSQLDDIIVAYRAKIRAGEPLDDEALGEQLSETLELAGAGK
ncbi:MAG TPA: ATP-binding cassette domain-containing protein [Thermoplasmata archaeon]|nr:ATP-binding cassette domain-containing protein [Thermoplasmata archaeon]